MILPEHAGVANAIGAVVGQITQRASATITSPAEGRFVAHLPGGVQQFTDQNQALAALEAALTAQAREAAQRAGAEEVHLSVARDLREAEIEGRRVFIEARLSVTASGRPRVAHP
jgi:demethoxyubiquinone hydroxylase (CLK1/Coq7/Cat5 family)